MALAMGHTSQSVAFAHYIRPEAATEARTSIGKIISIARVKEALAA